MKPVRPGHDTPVLEPVVAERLRALSLQTTIGSPETQPFLLLAPIHAQGSQPAEIRRLPAVPIDYTGLAQEASVDFVAIGLLGEGGMGRVLLAKQISLGRDVAVKTLKRDSDAHIANALIQEGLVTGALEHPGVIPVHALGLDASERPVLVMKRVEGVPWRALIEDDNHPAWATRGGDRSNRLEEHLQIIMALCDTMSFAHSRGIIHRDLKPDNVLIGVYGEVYLADWGIALRLTGEQPGDLVGTPAYMAPEMARQEPVDERTDVFLLGAILHELLTGRFKNDGTDALEAIQMAAAPKTYQYGANVPSELAEVVTRATHTDRERRYAGPAELRLAVVDYIRHKSSVLIAAAASPRLARFRELLASGELGRTEIDIAFAEARFGLIQAIEQWPDNVDAKASLAELDRLVALRNARTNQLQALAQEFDSSRSPLGRVAAQMVVATVVVALSAGAIWKGMHYMPTTPELVREGTVPAVGFLIGALLARRRLMETEINRRAAICMASGIGSVLFSRCLGSSVGTPPSQQLLNDCLFFAVCTLVSMGTFFWFALPSLCFIAGAVACTMWPSEAYFCFSMSTASAILSVVLFGVFSTRLQPAK